MPGIPFNTAVSAPTFYISCNTQHCAVVAPPLSNLSPVQVARESYLQWLADQEKSRRSGSGRPARRHRDQRPDVATRRHVQLGAGTRVAAPRRLLLPAAACWSWGGVAAGWVQLQPGPGPRLAEARVLAQLRVWRGRRQPPPRPLHRPRPRPGTGLPSQRDCFLS